MSNSQTFEMNSIYIFMDSGSFNERERVDGILRFLMEKLKVCFILQPS